MKIGASDSNPWPACCSRNSRLNTSAICFVARSRSPPDRRTPAAAAAGCRRGSAPRRGRSRRRPRTPCRGRSGSGRPRSPAGLPASAAPPWPRPLPARTGRPSGSPCSSRLRRSPASARSRARYSRKRLGLLAQRLEHVRIAHVDARQPGLQRDRARVGRRALLHVADLRVVRAESRPGAGVAGLELQWRAGSSSIASSGRSASWSSVPSSIQAAACAGASSVDPAQQRLDVGQALVVAPVGLRERVQRIDVVRVDAQARPQRRDRLVLAPGAQVVERDRDACPVLRSRLEPVFERGVGLARRARAPRAPGRVSCRRAAGRDRGGAPSRGWPRPPRIAAAARGCRRDPRAAGASSGCSASTRRSDLLRLVAAATASRARGRGGAGGRRSPAPARAARGRRTRRGARRPPPGPRVRR